MNQHSTRTRLFTRRLLGHTVIAVHGELDFATTAALRDRMATVLDVTTTPVIVDLSGISFCDASGVAMLIGAQRHAARRGLTVSLAAPRPNVSKILRITGLDRTFTIHSTVTAALPAAA